MIIQRYGGTKRMLDVTDSPWALTERAPVGWGRPSPDFWLRPGEFVPWVAA